VTIPVSTDNDSPSGARIRALRLSLGLTQTAVAQRLGWPPKNGQLSNYEAGRTRPSPRQEARIVAAIAELAVEEPSDALAWLGSGEPR